MNVEQSSLTSVDDIRKYMFGGKAEFTLHSLVTNKHYTYRILSKNGDPDYPLKFLYVLSGSNNENDWTYAGTVRMLENNPSHDITYGETRNSKFTRVSPVILAFRWFINKLNHNQLATDQLEFLHSGKCSACGRKLTDPESIRTGLGPVCRSRL